MSMVQYTIKYIRWGVAFNKASSVESTISQINTIDQVEYDTKLSAEDVAFNQYQKDKVYFFTFFRNDIPEGFAEYNNGYFNIGFIDIKSRVYLTYTFKRTEDKKKLFFVKAQYWEYSDDQNSKVKTEIFVFTENGDVKIKKANVITRESIQLTSKEPIDVSGFYEDFPEFGEYDRLVRKDRLDSLDLSNKNIRPIA